MKRVYNLVMDFLVAVVNKKADIDTIVERRTICNTCEYKKDEYALGSIKLKGLKQCGICKCPIKLKTQYYYSDCPKSKW